MLAATANKTFFMGAVDLANRETQKAEAAGASTKAPNHLALALPTVVTHA